MTKRIKVLVVEDSLTAQKILVKILSADSQIEVVAVASSGEEALEQLQHISPDLITMDIHMPGMDGLEVTRKIMETKPVPIVVVSASCLVEDIERAFQLIEAGALTAIAKPIAIGSGDFEATALRLVQTVKDMAAVKVIKRWPKKEKGKQKGQATEIAPNLIPEIKPYKVIAIGASTGGPQAIETILKKLPSDYPASILMVQHIAPGFLGGMVEWLNNILALHVKVAHDGEQLKPGTVYLCPEGKHMGLDKESKIALSSAEPLGGHRPAVAFLFQALAKNYSDCLAILLTGMGKDGAAELLELKKRGATTIAQDKESSVIHGMPGAAIALGAHCHILNLESIATLLLSRK
jgi:two-component system chemotaxis response regulator CheB